VTRKEYADNEFFLRLSSRDPGEGNSGALHFLDFLINDAKNSFTNIFLHEKIDF
jgi:hypothetical protein